METRARSPRTLIKAWRQRLGTWLGPPRREALLALLISVFVAAIVAAPVVFERAVENVRFEDEVGTFPVEVGLCHDGRSTLDTGIFGKVFWDETGAFGFGAYARATGPPQAGGTLASYVDPEFFQANVAFIRDPDTVVDAYSTEMRSALWSTFLREEIVAALLGGAALFLIVPRRRLHGMRRGPAVVTTVLVVDLALGLSAFAAVKMFDAWECNQEAGQTYNVPGMANPTFSSPQMTEVVSQVRPFIDKNNARIDAAADSYQAAADASIGAEIQRRAGVLAPRDGETIVIGEADPQGSFVGARVRREMYEDLVTALGEDAITVRTISGDVTSNGTVAESAYVKAEAGVTPDIPVAAVGGDHDSEKTWKQMKEAGFIVPDLDTAEVDGLRVSGANDREHKTLFGGIITNPTGLSEQELGEQLREKVGDQTVIALMHQPRALAGFLGLDSLDAVEALAERPAESRVTPYDDGIPDQPPGIISIGHWHRAIGPWVLWNTDGDAVTWTVIDQLGTAGGVESSPNYSRFSTPTSAPLRPIMVRLQYVNVESGLQTGYVTIECDLEGSCTISDRVDVGLPGGQPMPVAGTPEESATD